MGVSIRDMFCGICDDHTAHMIFKSMVGESRKCLKCRYEYIVMDEENKEDGDEKS